MVISPFGCVAALGNMPDIPCGLRLANGRNDTAPKIHELTGQDTSVGSTEVRVLMGDRDVMVYALKAGYGSKGAQVGGTEEEALGFREEMLRFWRRVLN